jgi:hypothetical protein
MQRMTDLITSRCRDQGLVEDFVAMTDSCELNVINSLTGLERTRSPIRRHVDGVVSKVFSPSDATQWHKDQPVSQQYGSSSISAKLFSFFWWGRRFYSNELS